MTPRKGWNIQNRMLAISLGPALLLTLLLTGYFTYSRLQDLRQELNHTGQLIANQLAPAAEYGVLSGNLPVLQSLLRTTLGTPHVRFIEVRNRNSVLEPGDSPSSGHGIGLSNTALRLRELYGDLAEVRLDMLWPQGVACRLRLPLREMEELDDAPEVAA